jgi:AcrR family transcriptional regulator
MAEIARRAGVGTATLYRRFPTREDLLAFVFEDRIESCAATIDAARAIADPWQGFASYIRQLCALQIEDRAFTTVLLHTFPENSQLEHERQRATEGLRALIRRAQSAGVLHPDFREDDIVLLLKANDGVLARTPDNGAAASHRLTEWLLRSCRVNRG